MIVTSYIDRTPRQTSRLEPPFGNSCHSFFIEASSVQRLDDANLRCASLACDDDFEHHRPLNSLCDRLARVLRLDFLDQPRRRYSAARAVNAAAGSAAGPGADSGARPEPIPVPLPVPTPPPDPGPVDGPVVRRRSAVPSDRRARRPAASHRAQSMGPEAHRRRPVPKLSSLRLLATVPFALGG